MTRCPSLRILAKNIWHLEIFRQPATETSHKMGQLTRADKLCSLPVLAVKERMARWLLPAGIQMEHPKLKISPRGRLNYLLVD
jgi:hypothetical protein